MSYKQCSSNVHKLNIRLIINDMIYENFKYSLKSLQIFNIKNASIRKKITLISIIQNMLRYYIKGMTNVNLLKPKIMESTYIKKIAFNINGKTIHSTLLIPLNKKFNELKELSDERCNILTKTYDQL